MSYQELFPGKLTAYQTGCQSFGGVSRASDTIPYSRAKLGHIMRCEVGGVFTDLGPNKFNRVEFRSAFRQVIDMQARLPSNKFLNQVAFVDGMVVPNQDDLTWNRSEQLLQKSDDLFATQAMPIRAGGQFDLVAIGADQQGAQQVQPLMVLQAGADGGGMPNRRPAPLERRDQREAAFIFKNERSQQLTPLFLSSARPAASRKQLLPRRVGSPSAAASGCSSPCDPLGARHHWEHNELQTVPRSHARSAPGSSSLLHTHGHKPRAVILAPIPESALPSGDWAAQAGVRFFSSGFPLVAATDRRCGW